MTARAAVVRALVAVGLVACLAGCQGRPEGGVALSLYHRNLSDEPFIYRVLGTLPGEQEWVGLVPDVVSSAGCGFVGRDWELIVAEGDQAPDPDDEVAARVTAADTGGAATVAVAITVQRDGSVTITGGVPAWWDSDIQTCPGA